MGHHLTVKTTLHSRGETVTVAPPPVNPHDVPSRCLFPAGALGEMVKGFQLGEVFIVH